MSGTAGVQRHSELLSWLSELATPYAALSAEGLAALATAADDCIQDIRGKGQRSSLRARSGRGRSGLLSLSAQLLPAVARAVQAVVRAGLSALPAQHSIALARAVLASAAALEELGGTPGAASEAEKAQALGFLEESGLLAAMRLLPVALAGLPGELLMERHQLAASVLIWHQSLMACCLPTGVSGAPLLVRPELSSLLPTAKLAVTCIRAFPARWWTPPGAAAAASSLREPRLLLGLAHTLGHQLGVALFHEPELTAAYNAQREVASHQLRALVTSDALLELMVAHLAATSYLQLHPVPLAPGASAARGFTPAPAGSVRPAGGGGGEDASCCAVRSPAAHLAVLDCLGMHCLADPSIDPDGRHSASLPAEVTRAAYAISASLIARRLLTASHPGSLPLPRQLVAPLCELLVQALALIRASKLSEDNAVSLFSETLQVTRQVASCFGELPGSEQMEACRRLVWPLMQLGPGLLKALRYSLEPADEQQGTRRRAAGRAAGTDTSWRAGLPELALLSYGELLTFALPLARDVDAVQAAFEAHPGHAAAAIEAALRCTMTHLQSGGVLLISNSVNEFDRNDMQQSRHLVGKEAALRVSLNTCAFVVEGTLAALAAFHSGSRHTDLAKAGLPSYNLLLTVLKVVSAAASSDASSAAAAASTPAENAAVAAGLWALLPAAEGAASSEGRSISRAQWQALQGRALVLAARQLSAHCAAASGDTARLAQALAGVQRSSALLALRHVQLPLFEQAWQQQAAGGGGAAAGASVHAPEALAKAAAALAACLEGCAAPLRPGCAGQDLVQRFQPCFAQMEAYGSLVWHSVAMGAPVRACGNLDCSHLGQLTERMSVVDKSTAAERGGGACPCHAVRYCSRACSKASWPSHKAAHKAWMAAKARAPQ